MKVCRGRPKVNDSVLNNNLDKTHYTVAMEKNIANYDLVLNDANVEILKKNADNVIKSNKCNQCNYASSYKSHLRNHLKTHSGEKSNKCHQCDFAFSQAGDLRTHLKTHSREKSKKCKKCDFASSYVSALRTHLECTVAKSQTNATNATMHALIQGH